MVTVWLSRSGKKENAHRLLRLAFFRQYGRECPPIEKDRNGKPFFPDHPELFFSISHTRTHVMAVLGDSPCGCDVEYVRHIYPEVPGRVCGGEELSVFDFFQCWVLKESYMKVSGDVRMAFNKTVFSMHGGEIVTPDPRILARFYPCEGCRAAICCQCVPPARAEWVEEGELEQFCCPIGWISH